MTTWQRIRTCFTGVVMILFALVLMLTDASDGYAIIAAVLGTSLVVRGTGTLIYYLTMARYMVGGRSVLFKALIYLDLGAFTLSIMDVPHIYVGMYLMGVHGLSGVIQILRGTEAKRLGAPGWKLSLAHGVVNVLIALSSIVFLGSETILIYLYCTGLVYSAIMRIVSAFRRTAMVYAQ